MSEVDRWRRRRPDAQVFSLDDGRRRRAERAQQQLAVREMTGQTMTVAELLELQRAAQGRRLHREAEEPDLWGDLTELQRAIDDHPAGKHRG